MKPFFIKISGSVNAVAAFFSADSDMLKQDPPSISLPIVQQDIDRTNFYDKKRTYKEYETEAKKAAQQAYAQGKLTGCTFIGSAESLWRDYLVSHQGYMFCAEVNPPSYLEEGKIYVRLDDNKLFFRLLDAEGHVRKGHLIYKESFESLEDFDFKRNAESLFNIIKKQHQLKERSPTQNQKISFDLGFFDDNGVVCGLCITYQEDYPDHWYITFSRNSIAESSLNEVINYMNPDFAGLPLVSKEMAVQTKDPLKKSKIAREAIFHDLESEMNSKAVSALIQKIFKQGQIDEIALKELQKQLVFKHNISYDKPNKINLIETFKQKLPTFYRYRDEETKKFLDDLTAYIENFDLDAEDSNYKGEYTLAHLEHKLAEFQKLEASFLKQFSDQELRTLEYLETLEASNSNVSPLRDKILNEDFNTTLSQLNNHADQYRFTSENLQELSFLTMDTKTLLVKAYQELKLVQTTNARLDPKGYARHYQLKKRYIEEITGRFIRQGKAKTDIETILINENPDNDIEISDMLFPQEDNPLNALFLLRQEVNLWLQKQCKTLEETAAEKITLPENFINNRVYWQNTFSEDSRLELLHCRQALQALISDNNLTHPTKEQMTAAKLFFIAFVALVSLINPIILVITALAACIAAFYTYKKTGSIDFINSTKKDEFAYKLGNVGAKLRLFLPLDKVKGEQEIHQTEYNNSLEDSESDVINLGCTSQ